MYGATQAVGPVYLCTSMLDLSRIKNCTPYEVPPHWPYWATVAPVGLGVLIITDDDGAGAEEIGKGAEEIGRGAEETGRGADEIGLEGSPSHENTAGPFKT